MPACVTHIFIITQIIGIVSVYLYVCKGMNTDNRDIYELASNMVVTGR